MTFTAKAYGTLLIDGLVLKGAVEGAERIFLVLKGAFECFSSPSMLMFSISYKQLPLWHGRGRRFDPDQVHQLNQSFRAPLPSQLGSILAANFQRPEKIASLPPLS
jgi:hypothetical protein